MSASALKGLRCHLCHSDYPAEALYVCQKCLGPLEPVYDYGAIRLTNAVCAFPFWLRTKSKCGSGEAAPSACFSTLIPA